MILKLLILAASAILWVALVVEVYNRLNPREED